MEIRKATIEDCAPLTALRVEMRKEREKPDSEEKQRNFYNLSFRYFEENIKNDNFIAYVALEDNKMIATSGLCFCFAPPTYGVPDGKIAYIMNMYTVPAYRKRGIASMLLDWTVKEAVRHGCSEIVLNASDMGRPIYEEYGFIGVSNHMVYYAGPQV